MDTKDKFVYTPCKLLSHPAGVENTFAVLKLKLALIELFGADSNLNGDEYKDLRSYADALGISGQIQESIGITADLPVVTNYAEIVRTNFIKGDYNLGAAFRNKFIDKDDFEKKLFLITTPYNVENDENVLKLKIEILSKFGEKKALEKKDKIELGRIAEHLNVNDITQQKLGLSKSRGQSNSNKNFVDVVKSLNWKWRWWIVIGRILLTILAIVLICAAMWLLSVETNNTSTTIKTQNFSYSSFKVGGVEWLDLKLQSKSKLEVVHAGQKMGSKPAKALEKISHDGIVEADSNYYYSWDRAKESCPSGFKLPSMENFKAVIRTIDFGKALNLQSINNSDSRDLISQGLKFINEKTNFAAVDYTDKFASQQNLPGYIDMLDSNLLEKKSSSVARGDSIVTEHTYYMAHAVKKEGLYAAYWMDSYDQDSTSSFVFEIDQANKMISISKKPKSNLFSVRCVKASSN